ncbi:MAG: carbon starvation protein A [Thermoplasmata archaeon]|nr:carbon starvation protein A [Thermoplasmata archaeon]
MWLLLVCLLCLVLGYVLYSRFVERMVIPFRPSTPALQHGDGIDYVPMTRRKNQLIELLNIAGTGPIFGALMGAKWGPIVFIWIVAGTIFGGAVHDYMCGMMSERNDGKSASFLVRRYLSEKSRFPVLILLLFVLIMVCATFARSASDLLCIITDVPSEVWIIFIIIYFVLSTVLPINMVIGRIYPVFGVLLIAMAVVVTGGLIMGGYEFPEFTLENLHPNGTEFFPDMFITVACGAISGFHATQAPMVARCITDERDGRTVFYGAMVIESVIALLWAMAGLAFFHGTVGLADALAAGGASTVVYDIATGVAGPVGGILAVIGVIICPITSGDTALRSARLMVQDDKDIESKSLKKVVLITGILLIPVIFLCTIDFSVLWNYFSWLNQTLACLMLWTAVVFVLSYRNHINYALFIAIPAVFMTMVTSSFILHANIGLGLDYNISMILGALFTVCVVVVFVRYYIRMRKKLEAEAS